LLIEC